MIKVGKKFKRTVAKNLSYKGKISLLTISSLKEIGQGRAATEQLQKKKRHYCLKKERKSFMMQDFT
ncbi:MAG: DUF6088 family protein [Lentimicrobiaceae bacterium]|nr:DUF6088 family protein [Lentimicrobiaceae bacterium]